MPLIYWSITVTCHPYNIYCTIIKFRLTKYLEDKISSQKGEAVWTTSSHLYIHNRKYIDIKEGILPLCALWTS